MASIAETGFLFGIIAGLILLPVGLRVVSDRIWPVQQALAEDLHALGQDDRLSGQARELLAFMRDHAFDGRVMLGVVFGFPLTVALELRRGGIVRATPLDGHAEPVQRVINRVVRRFLISAAAANPVCTILLAIELALFVGVSTILYIVHVTTLKPLKQVEATLHDALANGSRRLISWG